MDAIRFNYYGGIGVAHLYRNKEFKWILENYDNFELYYKKYYSGSWKEYFERGKGYGLYESGLIHFALKDFIKRN